jgi:predicted N-acyltransferase
MGKKYQLKIHRAITEISSTEWNRLVTPETVPFLEWEWLSALEESGSICPDTGWHPFHICLWDGKHLAAAAPLYLRTGSGGEYIYDYMWAEAAETLGRAWYPKMTGAPAATPAEGYRFLTAGGIDPAAAGATLLKEAENICRKNRIPSINLLWVDPEWAKLLPGLGYTPWDHSYYLWENSGFEKFDDYLSLFSKNQRKNIRKEYGRHLEQGISIRIIPGEEAEDGHYRRMFELFTITNDKFIPWDARWVNEDFFTRLGTRCKGLTAFVEARHETSGETLALAFLVRKGDRVWGRYWGAYEEVRDLHFAVCYYAPMDWCIQNRVRYFDPGAGSTHKIRRGFKAMRTQSWHKFFDPVLDRLFKDNIKAVNRHEAAHLEALNAELPYKVTG